MSPIVKPLRLSMGYSSALPSFFNSTHALSSVCHSLAVVF